MNKLNELEKTDIIICLDIGDGECSAFSMRRSNDSFLKDEGLLYLINRNPYSDRTASVNRIPSVMYYDSKGNVTIGDMTTEEDCICISNFKQSPPNENFLGWDMECWQIGNGMTFRQCMFDFIRQLWKNIVSLNSGVAGIFKGKDIESKEDMKNVALFVGCPASDNWLLENQKKAYRDLICEATGLENVFIIPESTASAFGAVMNNRSIKYSDGVAVFDFGSSTADFTYMHGSHRRNLSWTLGASAIENTMYRLMYEDAGFDIRDEDFPYRKTQQYRIFEIRNEKEKYFLPYNHPKRTKRVEFHSRELNRDFDIDEAFMERVLTTPLRDPVWENGDPQKTNGKKGWRTHCKDFLTRCRNIINKDQLPVDRIVLAGGASNMYFIEDLCFEVFGKRPDCNILPYDSVSGGLCQVAKNTYLLPKIFEEEIEIWATPNKLKRVVTICETLRNTITNLLIETFEKFIEENPCAECTFGQLKKAANAYMNTHIDNKDIEKLAESSLNKLISYMSDSYTSIGYRCANTLYSRKEFSCPWTMTNDYSIGSFSSNNGRPYDFCKDFDIATFLKGLKWGSYILNGLSDEASIVNTSAYRYTKKDRPLSFFNTVTRILHDLKIPYVYDSSMYVREGETIDRFDTLFKDMIYQDTYYIVSNLALQTEKRSIGGWIQPSPPKESTTEYSYDDSETYTVGDLLRDMTW